MRQLNASIQADNALAKATETYLIQADLLLSKLAQFNVIDVNDGLRLPTIGADVRFVASRPVRPRALAPL